MITIKDHDGQVLKSFPLEHRDQAFTYLQDLESWGIEATLEEPSLPETLMNALGASSSDIDKLKEAIEHEIDDHEHSSCAFTAATKND